MSLNRITAPTLSRVHYRCICKNLIVWLGLSYNVIVIIFIKFSTSKFHRMIVKLRFIPDHGREIIIVDLSGVKARIFHIGFKKCI